MAGLLSFVCGRPGCVVLAGLMFARKQVASWCDLAGCRGDCWMAGGSQDGKIRLIAIWVLHQGAGPASRLIFSAVYCQVTRDRPSFWHRVSKAMPPGMPARTLHDNGISDLEFRNWQFETCSGSGIRNSTFLLSFPQTEDTQEAVQALHRYAMLLPECLSLG